MRLTAARPQLLTVAQAATLLNVSERTVRRWIADERIPFLELPGGGYRIPQGALLASLRGTYDLAAELRELDARHADVREDDVRAAMTDDEV
jgi:excisionase family DNA binding protein